MTPMAQKTGHRRLAAAALAAVLAAALVPTLAGQAGETVDLQAIFRIKDEGLQRSR